MTFPPFVSGPGIPKSCIPYYYIINTFSGLAFPVNYRRYLSGALGHFCQLIDLGKGRFQGIKALAVPLREKLRAKHGGEGVSRGIICSSGGVSQRTRRALAVMHGSGGGERGFGACRI